MPRLLLFGGTTEARELLARLSGSLPEHEPAICCVATDYGAELARDLPGVEVRAGRLDEGGMEELIRAEGVTCVIDATHPYATEVTRNICSACENTKTPLLRVCRPSGLDSADGVTTVGSCREAADLLNHREGNVLLTVGSKELREFTAVRGYRERLFARVLPTSGVLRACEELGFDPGHVLAMQGPFSLAMNRAMLEDTGARILVTKDGGAVGGVEAKVGAARELGVEVILIARPDDKGHSLEEGVLWARRMLGLGRPPLFPLLLDLEGRNALVIGGGGVALRRTATLLRCGARVKAVSPVFRDDFPREAERVTRPFKPSDLEEMTLAVAASDDREVNRRAGCEARARNIPVSVADSASEGSFFFPSLVVTEERPGQPGAAASVSTAGVSCALTRRLADRLRGALGDWTDEEWARIMAEEGGTRT